jgi:rSAM/selenodomain-associated transferase 1
MEQVKAMKTTICIFAKPPIPGKAKTRLVAAVGNNGAAEVAKALLDDVVSAARHVQGARVIVSTTEMFQIDEAMPMWLQPPGDLGFRLEKTMQRALERADCALAVGADTPGLTPLMLAQAADRLLQNDAVLGPTDDGGYYMVGLRRCPDGLFTNIRWSAPETLRDTIDQLERFNLEYSTVPKWFDLDTPNDLQRVRSLIRAGVNMGANLSRVLGATEFTTVQELA